MFKRFLVGVILFAGVAAAQAQMRITEWMYDGAGGEFVEFTNVGAVAVNMTGWKFEDDHHQNGGANYYDLSGFGVVAPGRSVLLVQGAAASFRTNWGVPALVPVLDMLGVSAGNNLGRNDILNLLDASMNQVDILHYGDQTFPGTIRTTGKSGNPSSPAALGTDNVSQWTFSVVGDAFGSHLSANNEIGNPGQYLPEPSALVLLAVGGAFAARRR